MARGESKNLPSATHWAHFSHLAPLPDFSEVFVKNAKCTVFQAKNAF
jgi:hypothetical protein